MTVPSGFRRNSEIPKILTIHYADLSKSDIQIAQGFSFTRPLRTVLDLMADAMVEQNIIEQALKQAADRGLITRQQVSNTKMSRPARKMMEAVFSKVA